MDMILYPYSTLRYTLLAKQAPDITSITVKLSNKSHTLVGNKIVDHSDVVGAVPVSAATNTSSFST